MNSFLCRLLLYWQWYLHLQSGNQFTKLKSENIQMETKIFLYQTNTIRNLIKWCGTTEGHSLLHYILLLLHNKAMVNYVCQKSFTVKQLQLASVESKSITVALTEYWLPKTKNLKQPSNYKTLCPLVFCSFLLEKSADLLTLMRCVCL